MGLLQHGNTGTGHGAGYTIAIMASDRGFTRLWEGLWQMKIFPGINIFIDPQIPEELPGQILQKKHLMVMYRSDGKKGTGNFRWR